MTATVPIGEFSRLTYLSVKALRYYHDIALLEPAAIDPGSGYRRYSVDQVPSAHLIRRLRALDMPVEEIRTVLGAADGPTRDAALCAHLLRMEEELNRTRDVVASLRALLAPGTRALAVEYRSTAAFPALTVTDAVARADIGAWCGSAFALLHRTLAAAGVPPAGPGGATYSAAWFAEDAGEVTAYVPVPPGTGGSLPAAAGTHPAPLLTELPGGRFAVAVHEGGFEDFDRSYGALGSHVAAHDVSLPEPIREIYLAGPDRIDDPAGYRTEICWPIR
ncbi:MerR family transcriptional regulator [Nocardia asteroides]|uniref:MerR family transcriptional regulator n=1 Tax=Nocardia asteroides TaxID=1824 RepID=UPI001E2B3C50|nr:MerR family transcriptional regulator [Nocardia asteroides]UGT59482.1 MerR family transcriptional regulator [Nocardia asteroides]